MADSIGGCFYFRHCFYHPDGNPYPADDYRRHSQLPEISHYSRYRIIYLYHWIKNVGTDGSQSGTVTDVLQAVVSAGGHYTTGANDTVFGLGGMTSGNHSSDDFRTVFYSCSHEPSDPGIHSDRHIDYDGGFLCSRSESPASGFSPLQMPDFSNNAFFQLDIAGAFIWDWPLLS